MWLLDGAAVAVGDRTVPADGLGGRRAVLCLAVLAVQAGRSVSREVLADAVWDDALPPSWRANLRGVVSELRGTLGDAVAGTSDGYRLKVSRHAVDVLLLEQQATQAEAADAQAAWELAAGALPAVGAVPLRGYESAWTDRLRTQVAESRRRLLVRAVEAGLELGRAWNVEPLARNLVGTSPLREDGHRLLIQVLSAAGDRAGALTAYEACRRVLQDQLGTRPDPRTEALFLELLRGRPRLAVVAPPARPAPAGSAPGRPRTVDWALTAARAALDVGMYDDAARIAGRGLADLDRRGADDDTDDGVDRLALRVVLGAARRQLGDPDGKRLLHVCVADARAAGQAVLLADAALGFTAGGPDSGEPFVDDELLDVYRTALEALHPHDVERRARLLAHLAGALAWRRDGATGRATASEAVALARAGAGGNSLFEVLSSARQALSGALQLDVQGALDDELAALASSLDDPDGRAQAALWQLVTAVERGEGEQLEQLLRTATTAAGEARSAATGHSVAYHGAALALLRGDLAGAAGLTDEAASIGRRGGMPEQVVEAIRRTQLLPIWEATGRLARHRAETVAFFGGAGLPEWSSVVARVEAAVGDRRTAGEHLGRYLRRYSETGPTVINPVALAASVAWPVAVLGAQEEAAALYPLLLPYAAYGGFFAHFAGPVALSLGLLARTVGDRTAAQAHFLAAAEFCTRLGAPLVAARCRQLLEPSPPTVVPAPRSAVDALGRLR